MQHDEGAHGPREDDVEPVQPPRLGGHDRRRVDHHDRVELQPLGQRGGDDGDRRGLRAVVGQRRGRRARPR